ncbi:MAG: sigma-E factor negative regulatory protein [Thermomonas sp.]
MNNEIAMDATDLTQLSSREQLSALMDGALPADETRFLLRRLQHDDSLAECWERWRLSAEVMRGLAPTQRLPSDFASRVAASLRGDELHATSTTDTASAAKSGVRSHAWLRWGGGAAMAASLAVVAFMTQQAGLESPGNLPDNTIVAATNASPSFASAAIAVASAPTPSKPATQDPANAGFESQTAALASAVAIITKPSRNTRRAGTQIHATQAAILPAVNEVQSPVIGAAVAVSTILPLMPQAGITTRPWPRSVLPQYGNAGMSVGFGDSAGNSVSYNPFQVRTQIGNLPSKLSGHLDGQADKPPASDRDGEGQERAAGSESPQP